MLYQLSYSPESKCLKGNLFSLRILICHSWTTGIKAEQFLRDG